MTAQATSARTGLTGAQTVLTELRQAIQDGGISAGEVLYEAAVGERFGVSRTPAREALVRLVEEGFVRRLRRGYAVIGRSPEEIIEIFDARTALETAVAEFAAERRTDLEVERLHRLNGEVGRLIDALEASTGQEHERLLDEILERNVGWHRLLRDSARHGLLGRMTESVLALQGMYNDRMRELPVSHLREAQSEHVRLVEALRARDSQTAAGLMRQHFQAVREARVTLFVAGSDPDTDPARSPAARTGAAITD